jgi:uncharacterized protein (DUF2235 family)
MKRIIMLIDGTWNEEGKGNDTNIAKLDPNYQADGAPLIKPVAADGTRQLAFYHDGVGNDPDFVKHWLGGAIGIGLRKIVLEAYAKVATNYERGDEIYILGVLPRRLCRPCACRVDRRVGNPAIHQPSGF